jgi:translation initiation factor 2B subunit (eIF-2B alpha/beta/delta family)
MDDLTRRIIDIREDREHGSRWLVRSTIQLLRDLAMENSVAPAARRARISQAGHELAHARPAMAALAGAIGRILAAPGGTEGMARVAEQLLQAYDMAPEQIATFARPYLQGTLLLHSLSGTVLAVVNACLPAIEQIIILEGRPLYEGRTVAQRLSGQAPRLTLITDAQADIFLPMCQALVVGADSILADGSILNKAGTALLAWAARGHGVPLYVLSETLKISPQSWSGDLALLEEHASSEVWEQPATNLAVRNFYFDYTPAHLVTRIITEQGPLSLCEIQRQADQLRKVSEIV